MFLFTIKNGYRFVQPWVKNPIYVECFGNQFRRSIEFMNAGQGQEGQAKAIQFWIEDGGYIPPMSGKGDGFIVGFTVLY